MMSPLRIAAAIVLASGFALMTTASAEAATISYGSSVSFSFSWLPTGGTGIADATGVDVTADSAVVICALTAGCLGDYAPVTGFVSATYYDFSFAPLGPPPGGPVSPLWTFTFGPKTYSFDLASVAIVSQTSTGLVLKGGGSLSITGLTPAVGKWSFSGDTSGGTITFSSTATAVPDGGSTMALLGLALLGVRVARRKLSV